MVNMITEFRKALTQHLSKQSEIIYNYGIHHASLWEINREQDGGSTLHKEAGVGHCTSLVFLLYPWSYIHEDGFIMYTEKKWQIVSRGEDTKYKHTYLWTSLSPLLFVICHVSPLLGSSPGWEISNPCFWTSWIYLEHEEREITTLKAWNRESP